MFLDALQKVPKFPLKTETCPDSELESSFLELNQMTVDMSRSLWRLAKILSSDTLAFSSNLRHLQLPALHGQHGLHGTFPEQSVQLAFKEEYQLRWFFCPLELLRPIFHTVFERVGILIHNLHPFTSNLRFIPLFCEDTNDGSKF